MKPKNYISKDANISKEAVVEAPVRIYGSTKLGRLVNVGRFSYIHTRSTVHSGSSVARYCSIGKNVEIGPFDHPMERLSTSPVSYNMHLHFPDYVDVVKREKLPRDEKPAQIGNDVWIGSNSIVIRGVTIGNGAVVRAGSVVTKDVAPYSIVAGIPARHIRFRFAEDICETLNALEWWNLPVEQLELIPFADVEKSIEAIKLLRSAPPAATPEHESPIDETPSVVASSGEGSNSETPSKPQPEEAAEQQDATVSALRAQIANIEQGKPDTPHAKANAKKKADFLAYIQHKLFELDTPSTVLELLEQNVKKLHIEYDLLNGENLEILNNKVLAINDLAICDTAESGELSTDVKKMILSIMSSKT